ncbi:MAG: hypothetical protein NWF01_07185 [Candidatus Bathyarchaeota archaeon]|nr:hypothetical protein [Candidatus Bathyarchaeota archaeon]
MVKKKAYCIKAAFLAVSLLFSMFLTVAAQSNTLAVQNQQWQPPENFVDPVTLKIQELKEQGLNTEQITAELEKLNMGWYPKTGATWIGRTLTSEELAKMPARTQSVASDGKTALRWVDRVSVMRTSSASWTGISSEMICGSMNVGSEQTLYHYVTMQLGDLSDLSSWTEVLVTHNYGETYKWHSYDYDEGGWSYYADKNTASSAADTYVIMLDGTSDGNGYNYDIWINYQWVRSGHLPSLYVQGGFQKEIFSDSGTFTNDASNAVFYRNWLHNAQGWSYWTNAISTQFSANAPVRESHTMGALSYNWQTWVQN